MATPSELRQRAMDLEAEADEIEARRAKSAAADKAVIAMRLTKHHAHLRRQCVDLRLLGYNEAYRSGSPVPWDEVRDLALERAIERLETTP